MARNGVVCRVSLGQDLGKIWRTTRKNLCEIILTSICCEISKESSHVHISNNLIIKTRRKFAVNLIFDEEILSLRACDVLEFIQGRSGAK